MRSDGEPAAARNARAFSGLRTTLAICRAQTCRDKIEQSSAASAIHQVFGSGTGNSFANRNPIP
jgi:hypothetical protein